MKLTRLPCRSVYSRMLVFAVAFSYEKNTPGNVLAVRWRVPSTVEGAQYSGGCPVQWRAILQYSGGLS